MIFRFDGQEFSDTRNTRKPSLCFLFSLLFPFCYAFLYFLLLTFLRSSVYNRDMNRKSTEFEVETIGTPKLSNIPNARNKAEANPNVKYGIKTESAGRNARASRRAVQRRRPLRLPRFSVFQSGFRAMGRVRSAARASAPHLYQDKHTSHSHYRNFHVNQGYIRGYSNSRLFSTFIFPISNLISKP